MKIYTKKGDLGETSLFGGERVRKDHHRIEAYGTVDELNSVIGLVISFDSNSVLVVKLKVIQHDLFVIGADLATPETKKSHVLRIKDENVTNLENWIDELEESLEPLTAFILPSGTPAASQLHIARTVCRRAERNVLRAMDHENLNPIVIKYLNRLSDLLFVMSRFENKQNNSQETCWIPS